MVLDRQKGGGPGAAAKKGVSESHVVWSRRRRAPTMPLPTAVDVSDSTVSQGDDIDGLLAERQVDGLGSLGM